MTQKAKDSRNSAVSSITVSSVSVPVSLTDTPSADEMLWYRQQRPDLIRRYAGQWIAIRGRRLLGHDKSLAVLMRRLGRPGHRQPFLVRVPVRKASPCTGDPAETEAEWHAYRDASSSPAPTPFPSAPA